MKGPRIFPGIVFVLCSFASAADGLPPRPQATDYASHATVGGTPMGATVLSSPDVRKALVSELGKEYLVVEIGIYPAGNGPLEIRRGSFSLKTAGDSRVLPAENPRVVAGYVFRKSDTRDGVVIVPEVHVGYDSGGRGGYDPATGRTYPDYRRRGVYTSTGVGVLVGDASPGRNPKDREVMELELTEKGLPEGSCSRPTAGFLYFRVGPDGAKKPAARTLEVTLSGKTTAMDLGRH